MGPVGVIVTVLPVMVVVNGEEVVKMVVSGGRVVLGNSVDPLVEMEGGVVDGIVVQMVVVAEREMLAMRGMCYHTGSPSWIISIHYFLVTH